MSSVHPHSHRPSDDDVPIDPHMLYHATSSSLGHHDQDVMLVGSPLTGPDDGPSPTPSGTPEFDIDIPTSMAAPPSRSTQPSQISSLGHAVAPSTVSLTSTEQVTVFHCPVPNCSTKTYAKRGRRAIIRHLKTRNDAAHHAALEHFGKQRPAMTKQERSRKTSATYREKHHMLAQQQAAEAGEPYLAALYNPVLVKKHEAYVRKKIKSALASVERPAWPAAPGTSVADSVAASLLQRHLKNMETNVLWVLQEMDNSVYFPPGSDIPAMLSRDDGQYYRRRLRDLEARFPARQEQIRLAAAQLDSPDALGRASIEFQVWKKQDDMARAKRQLDRERYERECEEAMRRIEEYEKERTEGGIEEKVEIEMAKWREKMADKLKDQWRAKQRDNDHSLNAEQAVAVAAQAMAATH
ncbi:hypothetical protein V1525DRAFT_405108 [Lipomyces kononenkoae]|uniref:Uncharacterized protein n=1 Tax=Lipomyces kononenkoae TaxID=34357 RepID=A0ACC3SZH4_LIPKO